ncbi:hypothetical protein QFC20_007030 [Naganishia adeliensis]|uniref:Uncharacterized protein n=1 Tax=Naganishia adeliensis TaxID=92952 RepID=A0ACC2V4N0_9TREE|nr:hypothetical protein QFC20_007030 [Naganishia adeliensis]
MHVPSLRLLVVTPFLLSALAYPTTEDIPDPFSDPLADGPSLYQAWRASGDHSATSAWTSEQVMVQMGMKRRVEAFANWLNPWGEGQITVFDDETGNLTMPHRPAAFPAHLPAGAGYPLLGTLQMITDLPSLPGSINASTDIYGCSPIVPIVHTDTTKSTTSRNNSRVALVVRGHCSFSHKVRAAQARGADVVLVADDTASMEETDEQGRTRFGLLTMYSPGTSCRLFAASSDDTSDIHIPSSFISRASYLVIRDLMKTGHSQMKVLIEPDDGYDWPLSDLLLFVMLLPSVITIITILLSKYQAFRQRDRAPREAVLSLPEAIWIPEQWEKEDDSPSPQQRHSSDQVATDSQQQSTSSATNEENSVAPTDRVSSPVQDASKPKPKPHTKRKYYSKDECSICLGSFERGDVIRILPCGHLFHKTEVDDWLVKWKKVGYHSGTDD